MKALARLAVIVLISPALLLAQTATGQTTTQSKPAYANPADNQSGGATGTTQAAKPAASQGVSAAKAPAPAAEKVPYPIMSDAAKQRARQLYEYFAHDQMQPFYAAFAPEMKKNEPEAKVATMSKQMSTQLGSPGAMVAENFTPDLMAPVTIYSRTVQYSKSKLPIMAMIGVNEQGELERMQVLPVPETPRDPYSDYQDTVKLRLPFDGAWTVEQGGRNLYDNAFAGSDESRYTVLFVATKDGRAFDGEGKRNLDFYCYGQPVLAPAAGKVMQVVNTIADHPPGHASDLPSEGNHIVIAHGNQEYSMIPYLKQGSIKLKPGQRVKQGDVIGQCGDSGSTLAPHVEYRLQNTVGFPAPLTMPAQFVDYTADGKDVTIGEPLRGQIVANQKKGPEVETAAKPQ